MLSSEKRRTAGDRSSSYCPLRIAQTKATRKMPATNVLAVIRRKMTLIRSVACAAKLPSGRSTKPEIDQSKE